MNTSESAVENQGFPKLGLDFTEMKRKSCSQNSLVKDVLSSMVYTPISNGQDSSGSVVESNGQDGSSVDLKVGNIADENDNHSFRSPNLSSAESHVPFKRIWVGLSSQTPICQVYGCKKDLSSAKGYHKRHKVCEIHSKTAKVIVNGIEQRFCQQCSRFHLLVEFDGEKRSCRKRLAGHNERRRKPQSGRNGKLFSSHDGSGFQGSMLMTSSFVYQDILMNDSNRHIKHEDRSNYFPQPAHSVTNETLYLRPPFLHGFEKHVTENSNLYPHDLGASNSVSGSLVHDTSTGSEGFVRFDSASTMLGMSASGRALSLLSPELQNSSTYSSGVPGHAHLSINHVSRKLLEVNSQASIAGTSNEFNSSTMNSIEENYFGSILSDNGAANFTDGPTIDMLQLSTQLQQVEHQRQSMQVKQENDTSCGLKIINVFK